MAFFSASLALAGGAAAQTKAATDAARKLGQEAWAALDAQSYQQALTKATEAEALYHAPTHLLLIGHAQVGLGKLADALATYERLAAEPLPATGPTAFKDAQDTGRKRMKELLARVPSLLVAVQGAGDVPTTVTVDEKTIDFSTGLAVRLDPGEHAVTVSAPGFDTVRRSVTLPDKGGVVRLPIALEKPGLPAPSVTAAPTAAPSATALPGPVATPSRTPAYIAFGVAGVGIIAGAVTGGLSLGLTGDLKKRCPDNKCDPADRGNLDTANLLAHTSTATLVLGGVAAAAGIVLVSIDLGPGPSPARKTGARAHLQPWLSPGGAGLRGSF